MENLTYAHAARKTNRRLSTLALANLIVMAGASKAADTTTPGENGTPATPATKASTTPATKPANASASSNTPAPGATTMDEIVVTAKSDNSYQTTTSGNGKYTEPLLNTPQTITVIPQQLIKDQNATTLQQALQNVPGITFGAGEGGTLPGDNITIRGFQRAAGHFCQTAFAIPESITRDPFNIDQIEVVEGPASAYSGFGSTGGSVNLFTKIPTLTPSYEFDSGYGTNQYYRETVDINQPLGDVLPARLFA